MLDHPVRPVTGPSVWDATDFANNSDWIHRLSPDALGDIERAMRGVKDKGLDLDSVGPADFDLPALADDLKDIRDILGHGRGFVLIKGIDVEKYSEQELAIITFGLGTHIGTVVSQSYRGDRLGHVIDRGETDRYYTRGGELEFHSDPVDAVGLFCLRPAIKGGESLIASAAAVHNAILAEHPEYMEPLYRGYYYCLSHLQGYDQKPLTDHPLPIFDFAGDGLSLFYIPNSPREALRKKLVEWTDLEHAAYAALNEYPARPGMHFKMDFEPGDIQFLNNRIVMHARSDYEDHEDPRQKRHLYRLWMMVPDWPARPDSQELRKDTDRGGGGIPARPDLADPDDVDPY